VLDEIRRTDFARLDRTGQVYLDYTGSGLYADSQLREHVRLLETGVFGNPHSINPTSAASTEFVERARSYVLRFFKASAEQYVAIFTPNATGALRLVGEAYPFHPGDRFLLTFDNHNSVNEIREFARARGAQTTYLPSDTPELRVDETPLPRYLTDTPATTTTCSPTRPSRTSPACNTVWSGSTRRTGTAGTCCWTPPRTSPPTGSI
jgi:molybdenum cofactor sulfurtransferase